MAAVSGSGVVWQAVQKDPASSWIKEGKPLPYVPLKYSFSTIIGFIRKKQVSLRSSYLNGLKDKKAVEAAAIPVEKTSGPILMISGGQDALWPSDVTSEMAAGRLTRLKFPHPFRHLKIKEAGHITGFPYLPAIQLRGNMIFSRKFEPNTRAAIEAWREMFDFFDQNLCRL